MSELTKKQQMQLSKLFYSPWGHWKVNALSINCIKNWKPTNLWSGNCWKKQALWKIFFPPPARMPRPTIVNRSWLKPNHMHQMDVMYLPWDRFKRKTYKYALTVVDMASRYKEAEPLTSKLASQVKDPIVNIYKRLPLTPRNFVG